METKTVSRTDWWLNLRHWTLISLLLHQFPAEQPFAFTYQAKALQIPICINTLNKSLQWKLVLTLRISISWTTLNPKLSSNPEEVICPIVTKVYNLLTENARVVGHQFLRQDVNHTQNRLTDILFPFLIPNELSQKPPAPKRRGYFPLFPYIWRKLTVKQCLRKSDHQISIYHFRHLIRLLSPAHDNRGGIAPRTRAESASTIDKPVSVTLR